MENLSKLYQNLKNRNPNLSEDRLKREAWMLRDKINLLNSNSGFRKPVVVDFEYVEFDYVDPDYFE